MGGKNEGVLPADKGKKGKNGGGGGGQVLAADPAGQGTTLASDDKRVVWDSRDFNQIREAKEMFDQLVAQGLVPYKVGVNGRATSEVMDEFDPYAEEVIFLPVAMVAGG